MKMSKKSFRWYSSEYRVDTIEYLGRVQVRVIFKKPTIYC